MLFKKFQYKTLLYLLPALLIFLTFNVIPGLTSLLLSFFEFSGFETNLFKKFVGVDNFAKIYDDKTQKVIKIFYDDFLAKEGIYKVAKYEFFLLKQLFSPTSFIIRKKDMIDSIYNGNLPFAKNDYKGVGPDRFMILLCMLRYSKFGYINKPLVYFREHLNSITIDALSNDNKNRLFEKARSEVDEYYYTLKYGKYFSFFQNKYFFKMRFILNEPKFAIRKLFSKITGH